MDNTGRFENETFDPRWKQLYSIGGAAALLQLATIVAFAVITAVLGPQPGSVQEFFEMQGATNRVEVVLRSDFLLIFLIGGYLGTFPALYLALRRINPVACFFTTLFTFMVVVMFFMGEPSLSLQYLGDQYLAATTQAAREQLIAAGEAVVARGLWHGSGAYVSGILLQGSGAAISLVMLRSKDFSKVTAVAGLIGNALDLFQHIFQPFAPTITEPVKATMGIFYLVWFPMLARDLFRLRNK